MDLRLLCNGKINPIAVDRERVTLSVIPGGCEKITSAVFCVAESRENLLAGRLIDKITGSGLRAHFYPEKFCFRYYWNAQIATESGVYVSPAAFFETGLDADKLSAKWIENPAFDGTVSRFEKKFSVRDGLIFARLYISGLGFYASEVNGKPTDDGFFKPLFTDYDVRKNLRNRDYDEKNFDNGKKTVCYDTFDITPLVICGENRLEVLLGTGWYCNTDKLVTDPDFSYGTPKLFFEIHLHYADGTSVVKSDGSVFVSCTAIKSQLYSGNSVDFTAPAKPKTPSAECAPPAGRLICPQTAADRAIKTLFPVRAVKSERGIIYDFGENHSGDLAFTVRGRRGAKLTVRYFETLDGAKPDLGSCRFNGYDLKTKEWVFTIFQDSEYVLSGGDDGIFPLFHWNGYRYAEFICDGEYEITDLRSLFIGTDAEKDGDFSCSEDVYNRLYDAFIRTLRANMHCGTVSDCPHREKLPYTGDAAVIARAMYYSLDSENYFEKWLSDILAAQGNNGFVPYSAPYVGGGGGYWWSNALITAFKTAYGFFGDADVLERGVPAATKYIEYLETAHDGDYIIKRGDLSWLLGEWITPEKTEIDAEFMNTLAYYYAVKATADAAGILNLKEEQARLEVLAEKIAAAVNGKYYDRVRGVYLNGRQGAGVLPVALGIAGEERQRVLNGITEYYAQTGRLDTGMIITPVLLQVLSDAGQAELCHRLMTERGPRSFYSMLQNETTLCETKSKKWNADAGDDEVQSNTVSHCHPVLGGAVEWLHRHVAGLDLSQAGSGRIIFAPKLIFKVKHASARKRTVYGNAAIRYDADAVKGFEMEVTVPCGCTGEIVLPAALKNLRIFGADKPSVNGGAYHVSLAGGKYVFKADL